QDGAACTLKSEILIRLGRHSHLVPVVFGSVSPRDILVGAVPLILPTVRKPELPAGMVPSKLTFSRGFWLVIKEDGHMVTARQEPRLVLVSITCEGDRLILEAPGMDQLALPSKLPFSNKLHDCRIFGMDIKGRDCGDQAAQWFTSFLKTEAFRLVQFEKHMKGRPSREIFSTVVPNYQVAYPDCCPIMILSEASLADLNTRLEKKVKMDQFRPNIVVTGCDAFEEDTWDELLIGNVEMKKVLSCPRCILTTVDPDTGVIDRKEPLETLKSYRLCDPSEKKIYKSSPLFGIYYSVEKIGSLKVGDPVYRMVE
uniref:Mitochondrial amidoxime reducing component 2 n=1 Tax=Ursus americanus TaxID=9643 RepID=A0A452SMV8_URSAM